MPKAHAQILSTHQWENRLVLILTKDKDNEDYRQQLQELREHEEGVRERKLKVYHVTPMEFRLGLKEPTPWQPSDIYDAYKKEGSDFQVILIGLDGTVKLDQQKVLSADKLFETIDAMPMRQAEMRKNDGD